jgi:hypothetical protein
MSYLKVIESRLKAADPDNDGTLDERNYDRVPPIGINGNTMQIGFFCLLVFVASTVASANEFGSLPEVKEITNGQPADVAAFIERVVKCNHWGGEEPHDKERAKLATECKHLTAGRIRAPTSGRPAPRPSGKPAELLLEASEDSSW